MYTGQRTLRLADGPDEVHHFVVGRFELARYGDEEIEKSVYTPVGERISSGP